MKEKILATVAVQDFVGRTRELEVLWQHAKNKNSARGLLLLSAPALGSSELLRQLYDKIFHLQSDLIPFYFLIKETDRTAKNCAARFLQSFLAQTIAFRRQDAKFLSAAPDTREFAEFAAAGDDYWIEKLVTVYQNGLQSNDVRAFIKSCLSAPQRATAHGANFFVMIDNLHEAEQFAGEIDFVEELKEIFSHSNVKFVLAGRRRFLLNAARTGNSNLNNAETLQIEPLNFTDAGILAEMLAEKFGLKINGQTRDLIARQFDGNPVFIKFLLQAADARRLDLENFHTVEKIYTDEIFGGRIGKFYDSIFQKIVPNVELQKTIIGILHNALAVETEKTPIENWQAQIGLADKDFYRVVSLLNTHEIIRLTSNLVEAMSENEILRDYLAARFRLEIMMENRVSVVGTTMSDFLKRAPKLMARFYRQNSAIGLRELLTVFNCQEMPAALFDYSVFKEKYKGVQATEILESLKEDAEKIRLPQVIYTAHTAAFYPPIGRVADKTRSVVALGFEKCAYTDEDETIWIAAEIDSKLEADRELAEFWCDRLEMVAATCNFLKYKIWLIAPEGFAPEAMKVLHSRNAFGSSLSQFNLLVKYLNAEKRTGEKLTANEYEIIVPMGEDTELIAAKAIEEIARRHHFEPKAVNQMKTALIEACINATEHSFSPDRKIYQKFLVDDDKIVITIFNRGLRLTDKKTEEIKSENGRRGWGLKLIQSLMDEVKFEQTDDGTRISMTKYMKKS